MSYEEILKTSDNGRYRVRLEIDEYPDEPYDDFQSPLLRINYSGYHTEHIAVGSRPTADDSRIEAAAERWRTPSSDDFLFEKYLRAYYGVTQVEMWHSGSYWYVTYDSAAWRAYSGAPEGSANMDEYKAWCEGDVWSYIIEKNVTWHRDDDPEVTMETWETEDSGGGFYGYKYAEESALAVFGHVIGSSTTDTL